MTQELPRTALITEVIKALDELKEQLRTLPDEDFGKPSSLPDWSISQLVAHVHSLARAVIRQFKHAGSENPPEMYDGGMAGRIESINMTALMRPESLRELALASLDELRAALPATEGQWESKVGYRPGAAVADMVYATWREMLIHATDLDEIRRPAASWPQPFSEHLIRALEPRVADTDRIVLQPHGKEPIILGRGQHSYVLTGTDFDLAAWLAGRPTGGVVQASSDAELSDFPTLKPWPSAQLLPR